MGELGVIVPVYNVEKYLVECLNSIFCSDYSDFKLFSVDDGSPDKCGAYCDECATKDNRILVIHKKNGGLSSARNKALDIIDTEYVAFVDSDDRIKKDMFEKTVLAIKTDNADIACFGMTLLDNKSDNIPFINWPKEKKTYIGNKCLELLVSPDGTGNFYMNKVYKTKLFDGVRMPEGKIYEDIYSMHYVFEKASKTVFLPYGLYEYRINTGGISHSKALNLRFMDYIYSNCEQYLFIKNNTPEFEVFALENYVNSVLQTAKYIISKVPGKRKQYFPELQQSIKTIGNDLEKCCLQTKESAEKFLYKNSKFVLEYKYKKMYDSAHNHPKLQKILGILLKAKKQKRRLGKK